MDKYYPNDPVRIEVTLKRSEQFKMPAERDIFIFMSLHMTNEKYENVIESSQIVF